MAVKALAMEADRRKKGWFPIFFMVKILSGELSKDMNKSMNKDMKFKRKILK